MSALGHKQTSRDVRVTSALSPIADIRRMSWHVRFVPIADIPRLQRACTHSTSVVKARWISSVKKPVALGRPSAPFRDGLDGVRSQQGWCPCRRLDTLSRRQGVPSWLRQDRQVGACAIDTDAPLRPLALSFNLIVTILAAFHRFGLLWVPSLKLTPAGIVRASTKKKPRRGGRGFFGSFGGNGDGE